MKGAHVAIFSCPIPTCVNPTLSVVSALVRRGYRVTYVTSVDFEKEVQGLGSEVLRIPLRRNRYNQNRADTVAVEDWPYEVHSLTSSFCKREKPDVVLYDAIAFPGLVIAKEARITAIRMTPELAINEKDAGEWQSDFRSSFIEEPKRYSRKFLNEYGIVSNDIRRDRFGPTIYFYLKELQNGAHEADSMCLYAGRCAAERPLSSIPKRLDSNGKKVVMITASTCYIEKMSYYRVCLEALAGLGWHVVLAVGATDELEFGPPPPNTQVFKGVPQSAMMPQVDVIICFGGMTTLMECLYHGIPLVMLTNGQAEGELYADNVHKHRLGLHLRGHKIDAASIRDAVVRVIGDAEIQREVRRMQVATRHSPGGEETCNWVEAHL